MNTELILEFEKVLLIYTAPPDLPALLLSNTEFNMFILFTANIAPPVPNALLPVKLQFVTLPLILKKTAPPVTA